jgi:hypothetical protein
MQLDIRDPCIPMPCPLDRAISHHVIARVLPGAAWETIKTGLIAGFLVSGH